MDNYCAFSENHKCLKWEDYELTRHELEEADNLCHGNRIEIQRLYEYIDRLAFCRAMPVGSQRQGVANTPCSCGSRSGIYKYLHIL